MKILELIYGLKSGGAEKFVVNISNQFAKMGHEVMICTTLNDSKYGSDFNKRFISDRVLYKNLGHDKGFNPKIFFELDSVIENFKPDIVHVHLNIIPYLILPLIKNSVPMYQTLHNVADKTYSGNPFMKWILRRLYQHERIKPIAISEICEKSYEAHFCNTPIPTIVNGVPQIKPSTDFDSVCQEVSSLKSSDKDIIFIHVARHNPQKNQKLLIEAFNSLDKKGVKFQLLVIGDGFDSKDGLSLQKEACGRIHFLGEKHNIGDYLISSDAFCLTSLFEGLPMSLIEAMSGGTVPICTPAGGIVDVVDKKSGYVSEDFSLVSYIRVLREYIDEGKVKKKDVIERYFELYSLKICANRYIQEFQKSFQKSIDQ